MMMKNLIKSTFLAGLCLSLTVHTSHAAGTTTCIPGLPCVVDATPNDPKKADDGPSKGPNANKSDSKACDADFMNQIYARAFLEANRENTMAQATIRKPDSVLEYTCYSTEMDNAPPPIDKIFSSAPYWQSSGLIGAISVGMGFASMGSSTLGGLTGATTALAGGSASSLTSAASGMNLSNFSSFASSLTSGNFSQLGAQAFSSLRDAGGLSFGNFLNGLPLSSAGLFPRDALNGILGSMNFSDLADFANIADPARLAALPQDILGQYLGGGTGAQLASFTNGLTSGATSAMGGAILQAAQGMVGTQLNAFVGGLTAQAASQLPGGFGNIFTSMTSGDALSLARGMSGDALRALPSGVGQSLFGAILPRDLATIVPANMIGNYPALINTVSAYAPAQFQEYMSAVASSGSSIPNGEITQMFLQMTPANAQAAYNLLPPSLQNTVNNAITSAIPSSVQTMIPGGATNPMALIAGVQNLNPANIGANLRSLPDAQVGTFLTMLPPNLLNAIPQNDILAALQRTPISQVTSVFNNLSLETLASFRSGDLNSLFSRFNSQQTASFLNAIGGERLQSMSGSLGGIFNGRNADDISNILGALSDPSLGSLTSAAFNVIPDSVMESVFGRLAANGQLERVMGGISPLVSGSFSPTTIANAIQLLPLDSVTRLLNKLPVSQLESIMPALSGLFAGRSPAEIIGALGGLSQSVLSMLPPNIFAGLPADQIASILGALPLNLLNNLSLNSVMGAVLANPQIQALLSRIPGFNALMNSGLLNGLLGGGGNRLPANVNALVKTALDKYVSGNFAHSYLGGAMGAITSTVPIPGGGTTRTGGVVAGRGTGSSSSSSNNFAGGGTSENRVSSSGCDAMNSVYFFAKCNNIPDKDLAFLSFMDLARDDPRKLPEQCKPPTAPQKPPFRQAMVDVAENKAFKYVSFDKVDTYLKFVKTSPCESLAIPTGIMVRPTTQDIDAVGNTTVTEGEETPDKVCPNPGCYFKKEGQGGECVAAGR